MLAIVMVVPLVVRQVIGHKTTALRKVRSVLFGTAIPVFFVTAIARRGGSQINAVKSN
jgi:hypothetical protein